jgi:DUF1126 PH-like domain
VQGVPVQSAALPGTRQQMTDAYTWRDLHCGKVIHVYGRDIILTGADTPTVECFAQLGVKFGNSVQPQVRKVHSSMVTARDAVLIFCST